MKEESTIVKDLWHIIDNDLWAWAVVWGPPRVGKSTLALTLSYKIYKDWDLVLESVVFDLSQLLYKIKHGLPKRFPVRSGLHSRVPLLIWDDFGSSANKAVTQWDKSFDSFKATFDILGTKIAVLAATMVSPTSPTQQLSEKVSHEVFIPVRGVYKYDVVRTKQDYNGWQSKPNKEWLDQQEFGPIPSDVFKEYHEMRMQLADERIQNLEDVMTDTHLPILLKKIEPIDLTILKSIKELGPIHHTKIKEEYGDLGRQSIIRLKSRQLMMPVRYGFKYYKYDITPLGLELLRFVSQPTIKQPTLSTT